MITTKDNYITQDNNDPFLGRSKQVETRIVHAFDESRYPTLFFVDYEDEGQEVMRKSLFFFFLLERSRSLFLMIRVEFEGGKKVGKCLRKIVQTQVENFEGC